MSDKKLIYTLTDPQAEAVDPRESVWLSASAGTGKTQVLSARVLRLLLQPDTDPSQILCLTFTKAGAAEMATRVNEVLTSWVRMKPDALAKDLKAIGAPHDPATQERARTRFASVLDCPGGGLRIDTIHAFSQWLLAAFPEEAGLAPGTQPMEDRDRELLAHNVLAAMLVEAERDGEPALTDALAMLSVRMGPDGVRGWLMRCAGARELWIGPGSWLREDVATRAKQLLGLAADADDSDLASLCSDDRFDVVALRRCRDANAEWGTKTGLVSADAIGAWLAAEPTVRADGAGDLTKALFTLKGDPRALKSLEKKDAGYAEAAVSVWNSLGAIHEFAALLELSIWFGQALEIGRAFALKWDEAKTREGLIDFDDQIRQAAALLTKSDLADWIRYKLDRRFDHILIDEAQDTNEDQWKIIRALTDDFFSGAGQRDNKLRTVFVVGDYKQAIFRFQGTSPKNFEIARKHFDIIMHDAAANAAKLRDRIDVRELRNLGLGKSYRTSQPVLDFVDLAIGAIGPAQFGLTGETEPHVGFDRPGQVVLWRPVPAVPEDAEDSSEDGDEHSWISAPERRMADRIADQVKTWLREGYPLTKEGRDAGPGDVMVLVRKRRELAGLIVARLYAAGVPVAGVDRLRLGAPLAVKDLMAALRFAAQPLDDLSLACLLVSPLIGWSQEQLLEHGYRGDKTRLWDHLRKSDNPEAQDAAGRLRDLLRLADYESPQALLHWLLVGPWQGRRKLVTRLGREANDPIDELLNAALNYASAHTASLQGFIQWFDVGDGELKRETGAADGLVRVMTVHGSKGLQAPIVILADATGNPDSSPTRGLSLDEQLPDGTGHNVPLPGLRGPEKVGRIAEAEELAKREEREEHWRLLYVAMTRAEEALFVGGALGKREDDPAEDSWFARLAPLVDNVPDDDPIWGWRMAHGAPPQAIAGAPDGSTNTEERMALPDWATTPIGPEPRPPRPLAPSSAGDEKAADPPLPPEIVRNAARRGVLIHSLLERLPDIQPEHREERAAEWLARQGDDLDQTMRDEMLASALKVLDNPRFAPIFAPDALAEVPLAATVEGQVIAGTADRLLVTETKAMVVDFKTARRPPASLADMPQATLRQMGAYAAALAVIFPGREIGAAVLYTQTPLLIEIPPETLEANKPRVSAAVESFAALAVE